MPSEEISRDVEELRHRLEEAEAVIEALRDGSVDAMVSGAGLVGFAGAERPYRAFFEAMNEGGLTLDAAGRILHCNPRFATMVDASIDQLRHRPFQDYVAAADRERVARLLASSGGATSEAGLLNAAGQPQPVLLSMTRLELSHQLINCVVVTDLREQRATALAAIQESETKFRLLAENATDCIFWIDANGRYRYLSPASQQLFGHAPEEFVANPELMMNIIHPEDRAAYLAHLILDEERADTSWLHFRIIRRDGELRWISHACRPMQDDAGRYIGRRGSNHDITERKQAELELRNAQEQMRALFKSIPDLIWLKDAEGHYLACNSRFEQFIGAPETAILGKTDYDFLPRELADSFRANDRKAIEAGGPSMNEEEVAFPSDGHAEFLLTIKTPFYGREGQLIGVLGIARDITERKIAEEELRLHNAELARFNKATVGRELVMIEMKRTINALNRELGRPEPYDLSFVADVEGRKP